MTSFRFPAHCEPIVRAYLAATIDTLPSGPGPMLEVVILPVNLPDRPRFTLVECEADVQPEPASGVAEDE